MNPGIIIISLYVIRIFLVFLPQTGYIHPDEFFQSSELMAGKLFQIEHYTPWEYKNNDEQKVYRSITHPYLSSGFPYQ
eukprot:Pgem_evm1s3347